MYRYQESNHRPKRRAVIDAELVDPEFDVVTKVPKSSLAMLPGSGN